MAEEDVNAREDLLAGYTLHMTYNDSKVSDPGQTEHRHTGRLSANESAGVTGMAYSDDCFELKLISVV